MKNRWFLVCLYLLCAQLVFAQPNDLQIGGVSPNLYVVHTVQAKENWYSIGRIYNVSPKQLAPYNALSLDKALSVGQQLKVPLTAENFSQNGSKNADEVFVPVHHTIQEKEWLYRVSVNYNKVPIESLEKWNNINKDQAKAGLNIIVGYLKVKTSQSPLASKGESKIIPSNPVAVAAPEEKKPEIKDQKKTTAPPAETNDVAKNNPVKQETKPVITNTVATNTSTSNPVLTSNTGGAARLSYFKAQFEDGGKSVSGNSGIFKSTSGWNDGKFYALVNNIPVGTIIRVNNPVSGKAIFAKVLGNLPDMKESMGLIARLSDAAAAELDATGSRFSVELRY